IVLLSLIILLSIALLFVGIGRISNAFLNEKLNKIGKVIKYITGILTIIVGIFIMVIVIVDPTFAILILINLVGYTLLVIGITRIFIGIMMEKYSKKYRFILIVVGITTFIFAFLVLIFPTFGYFVIVILLSLSLLLNGFARITYALSRIK
ncbi:MAG: DUF308 domain-containing protein, partial [Promethearchaeia archaeon]